MRRHTYKKTYAWNAKIAYLTGLIASDGCLINDGRHINITSKDWEIIDTCQNLLDMNVKVGSKIGGYSGSSSFSLQFSNVSLYDFLVDCKLTPAKSKTMDNLLVPDTFFPDFLRGYFDGDGTIYGFWDKRWRSSLMYYANFVSASGQFLDWMQKTNTRLAGVSSGTVKPAPRASVLSYAKKDSRKLFSFMYYNPNVPKLTRKYQKFVDFLTADPYAGKELRARVLE